MRITITDKLPRSRVNEGSAATFTVSFFDDSAADVWTSSAPTSAKYRIDRTNADASSEALGWTSLTPAASITIAVTAAQNAVLGGYEERRQITVRANDGLSTQCQQTHDYWVANLVGSS